MGSPAGWSMCCLSVGNEGAAFNLPDVAQNNNEELKNNLPN